MTSQRDLKAAGVIMIALLITGIASYVSFSAPAPEEPVRIMLQNKAGKVLFTHNVHTGEYSLTCLDCHHNIEDEELYNCSDCHEEAGDEYLMSRADALHETCMGCHQDYGAGPVDCGACHKM
jgi:hypothetical protein